MAKIVRGELAAEVRRSPLRLLIIPLLAIDLFFLFEGPRYWIGVWPQASVAAQLPALYLGPAMAGVAAWVAAKRGPGGMGEDGQLLPVPSRWRSATVSFTSTVVYGLSVYAVGAVAAAVVSVPEASLGFLWMGSLLPGVAVILICTALGHAVGMVTRSILLASLACAVASMVVLRYLANGLELLVFYGDPSREVAPIAVSFRLASALLACGAAVAVTVSLMGWHPDGHRLQAACTGAGSVILLLVALGLLYVAPRVSGPLVMAREASIPLCSNAVPKVCVWPENRKYLSELSAMATRLRNLPSMMSAPPAFFEHGLRNGGAGETEQGFEIIEGYLWSAADGMAQRVLDLSIPAVCELKTPADEAKVVQARREVLTWLKSHAVNGRRPAGIRGGAPVDYEEIGRLVLESQHIQQTWVQERIKIIKDSPCAA
ncbi:hypothetical protein [Streptosporangium saharense]|uniref:hypothetical protein n=1 Tax=Streptosporangium saharense TaxID=1706840 RepID=UPI003326582E